jgi:hypothetical protein
MPFEQVTRIDEAAGAIQDFLRSKDGQALPEDIQEKAWEMIRPGGSQAYAVIGFAELVFARKSEVNATANRLAAACALLGATQAMPDLAAGRGEAISMAMRRRSSEKAPKGMKWPSAKDDPDPKEHFLKMEKTDG